MPDLYSILGVGRSAKQEDIKKAYREAVKKCHPDVHGSSAPDVRQSAAAKFKAVSEAYAVLGDASARKSYDAGVRTQHFTSRGATTSKSYGYHQSTDWSYTRNANPRGFSRTNPFESFASRFAHSQTSANARFQAIVVMGLLGTFLAIDALSDLVWRTSNHERSFKRVEEMARPQVQVQRRTLPSIVVDGPPGGAVPAAGETPTSALVPAEACVATGVGD